MLFWHLSSWKKRMIFLKFDRRYRRRQTATYARLDQFNDRYEKWLNIYRLWLSTIGFSFKAISCRIHRYFNSLRIFFIIHERWRTYPRNGRIMRSENVWDPIHFKGSNQRPSCNKFGYLTIKPTWTQSLHSLVHHQNSFLILTGIRSS